MSTRPPESSTWGDVSDVSMQDVEKGNAFSETVESIVVEAEARNVARGQSDAFDASTAAKASSNNRGGASSHSDKCIGGPLSTNEIERLGLLCASASSESPASARGGSDEEGFPKSGFALSDGDSLVSLISMLERHVRSAVHIDLLKEAHQLLGEKGGIEEWIKKTLPDRIGIVRQGMEAASILLAIMTSPGVDRRVVNEDSIEACIALMRQHLMKNTIPAITNTGHLIVSSESAKSDKASPPPAKKVKRSGSDLKRLKEAIPTLKKVYRPIIQSVGILSVLLDRIKVLVQTIQMDDRPIHTLCSGVLLTFEMDPAASNASQCRLLQVSSIELMASVFHRYPSHRTVILEDLFPLMLKLPSSKRSLRTFPVGSAAVPTDSAASKSLSTRSEHQCIQALSALIVSLVQSCVVMPTVAIYNNTEESSDNGERGNQRRELTSGLQQCQSISSEFAAKLLQRCSRKGTDGGASEFKQKLFNLVDDLLSLQLSPEYPAAEMILLSLCQVLCNDLVKATSEADANKHHSQSIETTYLTTAFDALGKICANTARHLVVHRESPLTTSHYRDPNAKDDTEAKEVNRCVCGKTDKVDKFMIDCDKCHAWFHGSCVGISQGSVPEIWVCDNCKLQTWVLEQTQTFESQLRRKAKKARKSSGSDSDQEVGDSIVDESHVYRQLLLSYLTTQSQTTRSISVKTSREFHISAWVREIDTAGKSGDSNHMNPSYHHFLAQWDYAEAAVENVYADGRESLPSLSEEQIARLMRTLLATKPNTLLAFQKMLGVVVSLTGSSLASVRKQSVKAISQVIEADSSLMLNTAIRNAVSKRFLDEAISVREAAVSLVGSYVLRTPSLANSFHSPLLSRLSDPGVSVRKRSVRIFRDILVSNPSYNERAAACAVMLQRAADPREDDGVRDLIHALFQQLWLESSDVVVSSPIGTETTSEARANSSVSSIPVGDRTDGLPHVGIVTPPEVDDTRKTSARPKNQMKLRSELAAEQMVEVVRAAGGGDVLAALLGELLGGFSDADKDRKAAERRKRKKAADKHCTLLAEALMEQLLSLDDLRASRSPKYTGAKVISVIRTVEVFAQASPNVVLRHLETILPYLTADNGVSLADEEAIVRAASNIVSRLSPIMDKSEVRQVSNGSTGKDLVRITHRFGPAAVASAVQALVNLAFHKESEEDGKLQELVMKLATAFYKYLYKHRCPESDLSSPEKAQDSSRGRVRRALGVLGSLCRCLDVPEDWEDSNNYTLGESGVVAPDDLSLQNFPVACYSLFSKYLRREDVETKSAALRALGGIFATRPRAMLAVEEAGIIGEVMRADAHPDLQLDALRCWRDILVAEEKRVDTGEAKAKMDSKENVTMSKRISGDQDGDSTLVGGVLAEHSARLFEMTSNRSEKIRFAAVELLGDLLRQGLINPMDTVPYLFALQGDIKAPAIRSLSLKLLIREGDKRPEMLRQRARAGVKRAYEFQRLVYKENAQACAVVKRKSGSGIHVECIFSSIFKECIRTSRKQREGLYRTLLGLFASEENEMDSKQRAVVQDPYIRKLPLLSFAAQVLAHLPYNTARDPLLIVYYISSSDALHGAQLVDRFASFLRQHGLSNSDEHDDSNVDEDALERAAKSKHPSRTKDASPLNDSSFDLQRFAEMCAEGYSLVLLLNLKAFLRKVYHLSETRCQEFMPTGKERLVDKALFQPEKMPYFNASVENCFIHHAKGAKKAVAIDKDVLIRQYADFRRLMRSVDSSDFRMGDSGSESENIGRKRGSNSDYGSD